MIPDPGALAVFVLAALVLLVIPGPAVLYIVAQSISRGRLAGIVSMLGIQVGGLVHVAVAAAGLSALLVRSAVAFNVVKYAGAAYLIFLGLRRILGKDEEETPGAPAEKSLRRLFAQGVVINVLNPKTALFFFSFLPQFVVAGNGAVATQMLVLGTVVVLITLGSDCGYAALAGGVGQALLRRPKVVRRQQVVAGCVYIGLGVAAAVTGPSGTKAAA